MSESSNVALPIVFPTNREITTSIVTLLQNDTISLIEGNRSLLKYKLNRIRREAEFVAKHRWKFQRLTKRERQIIQLLLSGKNNPQIAEELYISRRTVEQHRKNINRKLEIGSSVDLYKFAYCFNLV